MLVSNILSHDGRYGKVSPSLRQINIREVNAVGVCCLHASHASRCRKDHVQYASSKPLSPPKAVFSLIHHNIRHSF